MRRVEVLAPDGVGEISPGDDLVDVLLPHLQLDDGDIVVITSKVVSKAESRVVAGSRDDRLAEETTRVVATRGSTTIVRNRLGLTMAAAGIDHSNVAAGSVALLPLDPDASARAIRANIRARTTRNVAVVVTDTSGRAWREGQTDIAIGAAGLVVAEEYLGRTDAYGNELAVTLPAVADEIAGMADLAQGKLANRPFAIVRGRADLVLPVDRDGSGASTLIRADGSDLFGYGAREAVVRAIRGAASDQLPFGSPAAPEELASALREALGLVCSHSARFGETLVVTCSPGLTRSLHTLAFAYGWDVFSTDTPSDARLKPANR